MVTETARAMDCITHHIDIKQDSHMNICSNVNSVPKRRVSKSRHVERANKTMQLLPQQNGWNLATIKEDVKRAKPEAPKFLLLLYEILEVESSHVIRWSEDGLALQILDPVTVTQQILPKYFNHTNFHSFQRQLNYFGFRKWTKSKTDICTFSHPFFRENQPKLMLLIKRKKAPRRTPASGSNSSASTTPTGAAASLTSRKVSPCGKRRLSSDGSSSEAYSTQRNTGMHIQSINMPAVQVQPATNRLMHSAMTTPHGASSHEALDFTQDGMNRQYLLELNNVISPVAATECKKKAKKFDKTKYLASAAIHAPIASPLDESNSLVNHTSPVPSTGIPGLTSSMPAENSNPSLCTSRRVSSDVQHTSIGPLTSTALPTLNIVRSRLIRRQQVGGTEQQSALQQPQQYGYRDYFGLLAPSVSQGMVVPSLENRAELSARPINMTPTSRTELVSDQSSAFSNSFSDPVDILLRIKKSRASSGEGKDVGTTHEQIGDQNENLASLHNYLLGNSLFTNRLQAQLKFIADENEALRHLLDTKQYEVNTLQGERKVLQQENAVLLEDKNKLFEMNRDLLSKLFPQ